MLPPNNFAVNVTATAPNHIKAKICAKSGPPVTLSPCNITDINILRINGPHRSPKSRLHNKLNRFINIMIHTK